MREPDYSRENRRAWKSQAEHTKKEHQGHLATFLVNSPIAHPIWSYWMVALVHLRDIPGVPPARKHYPDAEFEFEGGTLAAYQIILTGAEQTWQIDVIPVTGTATVTQTAP